ncbi:MAG TPA: hypothetical protein VHD33_02185 [Legionellaceae bacterium]|nr:hypothetical protein [Legionellaceae bacterium]
MTLSIQVKKELTDLQTYYKNWYYTRWLLPSSIRTQLDSLDSLDMSQDHPGYTVYPIYEAFVQLNGFFKFILSWFSGFYTFQQSDTMRYMKQFQIYVQTPENFHLLLEIDTVFINSVMEALHLLDTKHLLPRKSDDASIRQAILKAISASTQPVNLAAAIIDLNNNQILNENALVLLQTSDDPKALAALIITIQSSISRGMVCFSVVDFFQSLQNKCSLQALMPLLQKLDEKQIFSCLVSAHYRDFLLDGFDIQYIEPTIRILNKIMEDESLSLDSDDMSKIFQILKENPDLIEQMINEAENANQKISVCGLQYVVHFERYRSKGSSNTGYQESLTMAPAPRTPENSDKQKEKVSPWSLEGMKTTVLSFFNSGSETEIDDTDRLHNDSPNDSYRRMSVIGGAAQE